MGTRGTLKSTEAVSHLVKADARPELLRQYYFEIAFSEVFLHLYLEKL